VSQSFLPSKTWSVSVAAVNFDAWSVVSGANEFNDPPPAGYQDVMVTLAATYTGAGSDTAWLTLNNFAVVGASNVAVTTEHYCGVLPNGILDIEDVFSGGHIQGNICWQVPAADVPSLVMYWDGGQSPGPWFALR
jgi:hypothetical protein